jgi:hypothetical protein
MRPTSAPQGDITGFLHEAKDGVLTVESTGVETVLLEGLDSGFEGSLLQDIKTITNMVKKKNLNMGKHSLKWGIEKEQ